MQRRRKKKANAAAKRPGGKLDKSLPSLPPSMEETHSLDETPPNEMFAEIGLDNRGDTDNTNTPEQAPAGKEQEPLPQ